MQLKHLKTVVQAQDGIMKVTAFAWSPNNSKLAVVSTDRVSTTYTIAFSRIFVSFLSSSPPPKQTTLFLRDLRRNSDCSIHVTCFSIDVDRSMGMVLWQSVCLQQSL